MAKVAMVVMLVGAPAASVAPELSASERQAVAVYLEALWQAEQDEAVAAFLAYRHETLSRWSVLGRCEQPRADREYGVWWDHPGPTYAGGFGFWMGRWPGTWGEYGGLAFADHPSRATPLQQVAVARNIRDRHGASPWDGCAPKVPAWG